MARRRPPTSRPAAAPAERGIRRRCTRRRGEPLSTAHSLPPAGAPSGSAPRLARGWAVALLGAIGVILGVATVAWVLLFALRRNLFPPRPSGLRQYVDYMQGAFLHLDFGRSSASGRPVSTHMREGLPADAALLAGGLVVGLGLGALGGLLCALRPGSVRTRAIEVLATLAISTPVFVVGLELLLVFGTEIGSAGLPVGIPIRYA